jgi:Flp pilus assembly pilin Flp
VRSESTNRGIARLRDDEGQALVEYALILMLVALVSIAVLGTIGTTIRGIFEAVVAGL